MKAQFTRYEINNMIEDTGDDYIFIKIFFKTDNLPEVFMPISYPYEKLLKFIYTVDEPAYNYLNKIRNDMHGYGPKHSKIFKVIESESFDIEKYIILFLESLDENHITKHYDWCDRLQNQTPEAQQKQQEIIDDIVSIVDEDYRLWNIKYEEFLDSIDQTLHELTLKFYPDLFEMGENYIEEYRDIISRATISFAQAIDKLRHKDFEDED